MRGDSLERLCPDLSLIQMSDLSDGHHSYVPATGQAQNKRDSGPASVL